MIEGRDCGAAVTEVIVVGEGGGRWVSTHQRVFLWLWKEFVLLRVGTVEDNAVDQNKGKYAAF